MSKIKHFFGLEKQGSIKQESIKQEDFFGRIEILEEAVRALLEESETPREIIQNQDISYMIEDPVFLLDNQELQEKPKFRALDPEKPKAVTPLPLPEAKEILPALELPKIEKILPTEDSEAYWFNVASKILGEKGEDQSIFKEYSALERDIDQDIMILLYTLRDCVRLKDSKSISLVYNELKVKIEDFFGVYSMGLEEREKRKQLEEDTKKALEEEMVELREKIKKKDEQIQKMRVSKNIENPNITPTIFVQEKSFELPSQTIEKLEDCIRESSIGSLNPEEMLSQVKPLVSIMFKKMMSSKGKKYTKANLWGFVKMYYTQVLQIDDFEYIKQIKEQIIYQLFNEKVLDEFNKTRELVF